MAFSINQGGPCARHSYCGHELSSPCAKVSHHRIMTCLDKCIQLSLQGMSTTGLMLQMGRLQIRHRLHRASRSPWRSERPRVAASHRCRGTARMAALWPMPMHPSRRPARRRGGPPFGGTLLRRAAIARLSRCCQTPAVRGLHPPQGPRHPAAPPRSVSMW